MESAKFIRLIAQLKVTVRPIATAAKSTGLYLGQRWQHAINQALGPILRVKKDAKVYIKTHRSTQNKNNKSMGANMSKGTIQAILDNSGVGVITLRTDDDRDFSLPFNFGNIKNYRGQGSEEMKIRRGSIVSLTFDEQSKAILEIDLGLPPKRPYLDHDSKVLS